MASVGLMTAAFPELAGTACGRLMEAVVEHCPEHGEFLGKSFASCAPLAKETAFRTAESIERLVHGRLEEVVAGYRWMCEMVLEEELHFRPNDSYRYRRFEDADRQGYPNATLIGKDMSGLLLSQTLWSNHLQLFDFYLRDARPAVAFDQALVALFHRVALGLVELVQDPPSFRLPEA